MILRAALKEAAEKVKKAGIEDARLEAEVLLAHALGLNRAALYARLAEEVTRDRLDLFNNFIERRLQHEPAAYITGHKEFFGLDFYVNHRVLIPRPETELLVEKALEFAQDRFSGSCIIADVGTGSGGIAISLAIRLPEATIYAIDSSEAALQVAEGNCRGHNVERRVKLVLGDLLSPLPEPVHIIVANLPYISEDELPRLAPEIRLWEPLEALSGGKSGLDQITRFLGKAGGRILAQGVILVEVDPAQASAVTALAETSFPRAKSQVIKDLNRLDRVIILDVKND